MAKKLEIVAVLLTVSCLLSSAYADGDNEGDKTTIDVQGFVYCDPCRVQFPTRVSKRISGATVRLECRSRENGTVIYTEDATTGDDGTYNLKVDEDFQEQICEVTTVNSNTDDCNEKFDDIERARVVITKKNGIKSENRYANPLGFMKKDISDECKEVIEELFPEDMPDEFKKKFEN